MLCAPHSRSFRKKLDASKNALLQMAYLNETGHFLSAPKCTRMPACVFVHRRMACILVNRNAMLHKHCVHNNLMLMHGQTGRAYASRSRRNSPQVKRLLMDALQLFLRQSMIADDFGAASTGPVLLVHALSVHTHTHTRPYTPAGTHRMAFDGAGMLFTACPLHAPPDASSRQSTVFIDCNLSAATVILHFRLLAVCEDAQCMNACPAHALQCKYANLNGSLAYAHAKWHG